MIGVDWGTSSFRAFLLSAAGEVLARLDRPSGILHIAPGGYADFLGEALRPWIAAGETDILMSGMIGSRQGWVEAPYLPCPADIAGIAAAVVDVAFEAARCKLVPGLTDDAGTPEVMRGEETQIVGVLDAIGPDGIVCLPGSHSKWARIEGGRIAGFRTYMTGEAFAAIRAGTILGRMMVDAPHDEPAFADGVARSGQPGHLLHQLFGVRTLGLFGRLADTASASYLSGLLIGHEVQAALAPGRVVHIVGDAALSRLYAQAITLCGGGAAILPSDAAAAGLARIGADIRWN